MQVDIPDPVTPSTTVYLSGGRKAIVRQATGEDSIQAISSLPTTASAVAQYYALLARCTAIDGVQMTYDTFRVLPLGVITKITTAANALNEDPMDPPPALEGESQLGASQAAPSSGA